MTTQAVRMGITTRAGWPPRSGDPQSPGDADSHAARIARAVALSPKNYARARRIGELAELAGMSGSSFHQHFRAVTTLSPL